MTASPHLSRARLTWVECVRASAAAAASAPVGSCPAGQSAGREDAGCWKVLRWSVSTTAAADACPEL